MCTYNGEKYLREQIDSILQQTHPADEIIIQDDGSTDKTVNIILEYQGKHGEIHLFRNETRLGINGNFYSAMERTSCDYIAIADQDDVWATDKIERQLSAIGDKMLCIGKDQNFYTGVKDYGNDSRQQNFSLLRMLFCSTAGGHTFLLSRQMLQFFPLMKKFPRTYDVPIQLIAAAYDSMAIAPPPPPTISPYALRISYLYQTSQQRKDIGQCRVLYRTMLALLSRIKTRDYAQDERISRFAVTA